MSDIRETARFIDAGEFCDWLSDLYSEQGVCDRISVAGHERWSRRWFAWRHESATGLVEVHKIDEFLVECFDGDLFLSDVPDCCFTTAERRWTRATTTVKRKARQRLSNGERPLEVAHALGVSPSTIQKWTREAKAA